jgi:hypothetical protein
MMELYSRGAGVQAGHRRRWRQCGCTLCLTDRWLSGGRPAQSASARSVNRSIQPPLLPLSVAVSFSAYAAGSPHHIALSRSQSAHLLPLLLPVMLPIMVPRTPASARYQDRLLITSVEPPFSNRSINTATPLSNPSSCSRSALQHSLLRSQCKRGSHCTYGHSVVRLVLLLVLNA